ncbi:Fc.00g082470.m01.CDS01 [Cosmosporella sp. VM-42]
MPVDLTAEWGNKLAELVVQEVEAPPPAENAVIARLTDIDGTGIAALVSKLAQAAQTYGGFALILKHDTKYKDFEWLQFITRQLVVDGAAKTGNLVIKTNTTSYQLVNSAAEITDYAFAPGSEPSNWNTCWKVDSIILPFPKPFFRSGYEYAISDAHNLTAILDAPGIMVGKKLTNAEKSLYEDVPDGLVAMKDELGTGGGISRAYFSDYLVKKVDGKWRIYARFDFSLTWNARDADKNSFTLRSLRNTTTTSLLDCHMAALMHKTTPGKPGKESKEPWKDFRDSILP